MSGNSSNTSQKGRPVIGDQNPKSSSALAETKSPDATSPPTALARIAEVLARVTADDYFDKAADDGQPKARGPSVPYVGFRTPKTQSNLEALIAAKVQVGDAYLFDQEVLAVKPFGVYLVTSATFYTNEKNQKLLGVKLTPDEDYSSPFKEKLIAVVVVRIPIAGKVLFKAAGMQVGGAMVKTLTAIRDMTDRKTGSARSQETWGSRSPRHADAAAAEPAGTKYPFARAYANIYATTEEPTEGEYEYQKGHSHLAISTPDDIRAFYTWFAEVRKGELALALAQFEGRCDYLRKVASGEIDPTKPRG